MTIKIQKRNIIKRVIITTLSVLVLFFWGCNSRQKITQEFYDETFEWRITIPKELGTANTRKQAEIRERGMQMFENTYGEEMEGSDNTISIFIFTKGESNVFEARYEFFDSEIDGDFFENFKIGNEMLYEVLTSQVPFAVVDTLTFIEQIDGLDFEVFKTHITYPDRKTTLNMLGYSRLFHDRIFLLDIIYIDEKVGQKMLDAWRNSTFGK